MPKPPTATATATTKRIKGKPRGLRRDRDCQSCRHRGIKCDLNRPRCRSCTQQGLGCCEYPQRIVWADSRSRSRSRPTTVATSSQPIQSSANPSINETSPTDTIKSIRNKAEHRRDEDNHSSLFNETLPSTPAAENPLSASEPLWIIEHLLASCHRIGQRQKELDKGSNLASRVQQFLQARSRLYSALPLASAASLRWGNQGCDDDNEYETRQLETLSSLNEALTTADPVAFLAIGVFALFDVVSENNFGEWQRHLRGGRTLLDYHCRTRDEFESLLGRVPGLGEIIAYFVWWDIVGNVVRHVKREEAAPDDQLIFLDWHRSLMDDEFLANVGCPKEVLQLFVSLAKSRKSDHTETWDGQQFAQAQRRSVQAMGQLLQLGTDPRPQGRVVDVWRCAAAIAVLSFDASDDDLDGGAGLGNDRQVAMESAVDQICRTTALASPSSRLYVHMATGVFLASTHASSSRHCQVLDAYWINCQMGEFPRYAKARSQCVEIWKSKGFVW